jgi:hypothetical protein
MSDTQLKNALELQEDVKKFFNVLLWVKPLNALLERMRKLSGAESNPLHTEANTCCNHDCNEGRDCVLRKKGT